MPAQRKVSPRQTEILISFMETHINLAKGRVSHKSGPLGKQATLGLWDQLSVKLNCCGSGMTKSSKEWKAYWNNIKYKVRNKATQMRRHMSGTGGGPAWEGNLTNEENRVLAILGSKNVFGEESVRIPFPVFGNVLASSMEDTTNLEQRVSSPPTLPQPYSPREDVNVGSTIHVPVPLPDHTPPFQQAALRTRPYNRRSLLDIPDWARDIEERRETTQERIAAALDSILDIQREVLSILNQRLPFFQTN